MKNEVRFYGLSKEEAKACEELVVNMRLEAIKKKAHEEAVEGFRYSVQALIDSVGLAEAKQIIRQMNRELREL